MCKGRTTTLSTFIRDLSLLVSHTRAQGATTPQQAFLIDQWHLQRDAATIQRNTCELRYLKQHNIKNLFIKLTWTLRICHFRRRKSTKTDRAWLTPWQQHVLQDTGELCDWSLIAKYDGLARRFFVLQFFGFWFFVLQFIAFRFFVLQFFGFWFFVLQFLVLQIFGLTIFLFFGFHSSVLGFSFLLFLFF